MSDTTSINTILSQRVAANKSAEPSSNLRITEFPKSLERNDRPQSLRGEVTRRDRDGTIHIKTDKGEIKARVETRTSIEQGDKVEIKLDKGNPPKTANIRPAPKQTTHTKIPPQNLTHNIQELDIPPNLAPKELVNGAPLKVEALSPQMLQKITQPYIENITSNLNLASNFSILKTQPAITSLSIDPIISSTPSALQTTASPLLQPQLLASVPLQPTHSENKNVIPTAAERPSTEIPLRTLMAHLISNPLQAPISINAQTLETPPPSLFSEVIVRDINPPLAELRSPKGVETQPLLTAPLNQTKEQYTKEHAGEIRSVLVGFTEDKHFPVLRITTPSAHEHQHYALQTPVENLPIGTQLELDITQSTPSPQNAAHAIQITAPPLAIISQSAFLTPEIWPIMQEINQALMQVNPQVAQAFSNIIPHAGAPAQLGGAALFFLAAMRSGDVQSWLGDKIIDTLKRAGKTSLLNRLGSELTSLARLNSEPISQEWRTLTLPLAWQNDIHKMVLHYRKEHDSSAEDDKASGTKTRFIMDLSLSQMGCVQLDGLFIGNPEGVGRLDLILRTEQGFSSAMKMAMRSSYKNALDDTQFTGELSFQDKKAQWVQITPDAGSEFIEDV